MIRAAPLLAFALLAGCGERIVPVSIGVPIPIPTPVEVRQIGSNVVTGPGERLALFVFDPKEPRPIAQRIRLATREARRNGCRLDASDPALIERETDRRGGRSPDTVLVAPVRCEA